MDMRTTFLAASLIAGALFYLFGESFVSLRPPRSRVILKNRLAVAGSFAQAYAARHHRPECLLGKVAAQEAEIALDVGQQFPSLWHRLGRGARLQGHTGVEAKHPAQDCASRLLAKRAQRKDLAPNPALPEDTRLWAALQLAGGGTWAGCVYDSERIVTLLAAVAYAFIVDLARLEPVYRIISFIALGVALLVVSLFYARHRHKNSD